MTSKQSNNQKPKAHSLKTTNQSRNRAGLKNANDAFENFKTSKRKPGTPGLSFATTDYVRCLANPFDGPLATVPDFPALPSRRLRVFSRGFLQTGTAGIGFCVADPYHAGMSDATTVRTSDSSFTGTTVQGTFGPGCVDHTTNSEYVTADYGGGLLARGRIVGAGIRVRYSSTELNRGGVVLGLQTPTHTSLGGLSFTDVDNFEFSRRYRPDNRWFTALFTPVYQDELTYTSNYGSPNGVAFFPIMGFIIQAPSAATSIAFEYEFFAVLEVQGQKVRSLMPSVADPAGFAAAQTTVQSAMLVPHSNDNVSHAERLVKATHAVASQTLSGFLSSAVDSAVKFVERDGASILMGLGSMLL